MKTPVTVTMLIVGGLLLIAPFAFAAIHEHEMAALLIGRSDLMHLSFGDETSALGPMSRFGSWLTGTMLCVVAIFGAAADSRRSVTYGNQPVPAV